MFKHPKKLLFSLIVILFVPKVDASQASSTSSSGSVSAQSQVSFTALMASLLAASQEVASSNNDNRDPAHAQASQLSPLRKIEETIKRGELLRRKGNLALATTFMQHAYDHSTKFPAQHAHTAGRLGILLFDQNKHAQALPYLEEAYAFDKNSPLNNLICTSLAYDIGRIYLLDQGVEPNYSKAFTFLSEAQRSICTDISAPAKNYIGVIYLNGLGKEQDIIKARDYFLAAFNEAQTDRWSEMALNNLITTLVQQSMQLEVYCAYIIGEQQAWSPKKSARMLKHAYAYLEEMKKTQKGLPFYLTAFASEVIVNIERQLKQIRTQNNQVQQQESHDQESTRTTGNDAQGSKTINAKTPQATMQSMFKEAVERYEAFLKKPTDGRYQEAVYSLREMLPLTFNSTETKTEIMHMLERIAKVYQQQKKTTPSVTATSNTQTKQETKQTQKWSLLDPFHQITSSTSCAVQQRLNLLQEDYLDVPDVIKLHGFINLWRARVGTIRILYTILPKARAIGIVQIDGRKDVYENIEELKHREIWFYEPNLEARLKERAEQKA